jgi:cytochrome P450
MNVDSTYYSDPTQFHGFRFVRPEVLDKASKTLSGSFTIPEGQEPSEFTELSDWQLWGTGKSSCTGRWYASSAIKTMLALFITKWDIALEDPNASRYFAWRTFIYPYSNVKAILKERA